MEAKFDARIQKMFDEASAKLGKPTSPDHFDLALEKLFSAPPTPQVVNTQPNIPEPKPAKPRFTIKYVYDFYMTDANPKDSTRESWKTAWTTFFAITGLNWNSDIELVNEANMMKFKFDGMRLPKFRRKYENLGMSIQEMIDECDVDDEIETIKGKTFNQWLSGLSAVCKCAVRNRQLSRDNTTGFRMSENDSDKRQPYDDDDIKSIFSHKVFKEPRESWNEYQWIPLIAFYTGMRIEEIAQLLCEDIKQKNGVWYFRISERDDAGNVCKTVKTGEDRSIPIHNILIEHGILDYYEKVKAGKKFFPDIKIYRGRSSHYFSKWWGGQRDVFNISDHRKVFHSIRHSFKDACRNAMLDEEIHDKITGHSGASVGRDYGSGHLLRILKENINKIEFPIDLPAQSSKGSGEGGEISMLGEIKGRVIDLT